MRAGVDPHRHAADHRQAGRGDLAAQLRGELPAVAARAPGADDRHGALRDELGKQRRVPAAEEQRRANHRDRRAPPDSSHRADSMPRLPRPQWQRAIAPGPARRPERGRRPPGSAPWPEPGPRPRGRGARGRDCRACRSPPSRCGRRARRPARRAAGSRRRRAAGPRPPSVASPAPVERLADVLDADRLFAGQVGDRARQPQAPVPAAGAQAELPLTGLKYLPRGVGRAGSGGAARPGVISALVRPGPSRASWPAASAHHPLPHRRRPLGLVVVELLGGRRIDGEGDVDPVGERPAQLRQVAGRPPRGGSRTRRSPGRSRRDTGSTRPPA